MKRIIFFLPIVAIVTDVVLASGQLCKDPGGAAQQAVLQLQSSSRKRITGLSVRSIPEGAGVYVAAVRELGLSVQQVQDSDAMVKRFAGVDRLKISNQEEFWEMNRKIAKIISPRFYKGRVPLTLQLTPGSYLVFVTPPATVADPNAKFERASVHGTTLTFGQTSANGRKISGVVSLIEVVPGENNLLVQLWHPEKMTLSDVEKFYPTKETFAITEDVLTKSLAEQKMKVNEAHIPTILRLLRKGGKVVYRQDSEKLIIQVNPSSAEFLWIVHYKD